MPEVTLRPRRRVDRLLLRGQLHAQQVQHVGGHVVVQGGHRVGHHQRHPAGDGPQQHEELVVDVEQADHRAGRAQLAQLGDRRVEVDERLGGQPDAAPLPVLADRRYGVSGQGLFPHVCGDLDALHRHDDTVSPAPTVLQTTSRSSRRCRCSQGARIAGMPADAATPASLTAQARTVQPRTVALRRELHRRPELGLQLPDTRDARGRGAGRPAVWNCTSAAPPARWWRCCTVIVLARRCCCAATWTRCR